MLFFSDWIFLVPFINQLFLKHTCVPQVSLFRVRLFLAPRSLLSSSCKWIYDQFTSYVLYSDFQISLLETLPSRLKLCCFLTHQDTAHFSSWFPSCSFSVFLGPFHTQRMLLFTSCFLCWFSCTIIMVRTFILSSRPIFPGSWELIWKPTEVEVSSLFDLLSRTYSISWTLF